MRIALIHTRIRVEERLLIEAFGARGIDVEVIDVRSEVFDARSRERWLGFDAVLDRCVSLTASLNVTRILDSWGVRCVNRPGAIAVCSDKLWTNVELDRAGLPTPGYAVGVSPESGLAAAERVGYPAVFKPTVGSWGRLVSRANDRDAGEAIIEHRSVLGSPAHGVHYVQEHVDKPGRDLRAFVIGGRVIAAIARSSGHWVTNTARGATVEGIELDGEARDLSERAAAAVGADICAVDLFECPSRGILVNEINHSLEFRNSIEPTGVDIPGEIVGEVVRAAGVDSSESCPTKSENNSSESCPTRTGAPA